ncbi:hypothetical protein AX16_002282 [Volvariella volvacea WC 439]|nr:hypothetical protein AX16_002282 [Volvariella volvacea WC 439]
MATPSTTQFFTFKDCLARRVLSRPTMRSETGDAEELDEFSSYLATESWPILPEPLKDATYENRDKVPDVEALSLDATPTAFIDTLVSYGLVGDSDDAITFLRKALVDYVSEACAPPPVWSSTRTSECEICERQVPLTYHHLIPRSTHAKVLKKGWHHESRLNSVAWLCRQCHSAVHGVTSNEDLAQNFYTVELLLQREDIQKWRRYASKTPYRSWRL